MDTPHILELDDLNSTGIRGVGFKLNPTPRILSRATKFLRGSFLAKNPL